ncbi:hypothetical protein CEB3_c03050 [Peptococcaceae bacterium CEB3]|nr:hypothetical protein CEB3_c03050 [Peptococcaceae bacterium CEB3]
MEKYQGVIVEESLEDNRLLNEITINSVRISKDENPSDRWHLYTVSVSEELIDKLSKNIKDKWYMHFWEEKNVIAIFKGKIFKFNYDDKGSWKAATEYGLSIGIPHEQLDFPIG